MTSTFRPSTIPTPQEYSDEGDALSQWEAFLTAIGLEKVWEGQGEGLSRIVEKKCQARVKNQRDHGSIRTELYSQIWSNDQGLLAGLKFFRNSQGEWLRSGVFIGGMAIQPHGLLSEKPGKVFHLVSGQSVENIYWGAGDYPSDWESILEKLGTAAEQGHLVPRSRWGELILQATGMRQFSALKQALSSWLELALDWENQALVTTSTVIPSEYSRYAKKSVVRAASALREALPKDFHSFGADFLPVLDQILGHHLEVERKWGKGKLGETPASLRELRLEIIAKRVHGQIGRALSSPGFLSDEQEAVVASWVKNLVQTSPAAIGSWNRLPSVVPGLNVSKNDVALDLAAADFNLGGLDRVLAGAEKATLATLKRWAQGEGCANPLALAVGEVLLEVPNRGCQLEVETALVEKCQAILDVLLERLGPEGLVWGGVTHNVWGASLGKHMNLPVDSDLSQAHARRLTAFLKWAEQRGVGLPEVIRVPFRSPEDKQSIEVAIHDRDGLKTHWERVARVPIIQSFQAHWDLLKPVRAAVIARHLDDALPANERMVKPRF